MPNIQKIKAEKAENEMLWFIHEMVSGGYNRLTEGKAAGAASGRL